MRFRSALLYAVLRLLAFFVPFGIMMLFPVFQQVPWLAALFAALIGLSLSLLFLRRPLQDLTAPRRAPRESDEDVEDAAGAEIPATDARRDQPRNAQNNSTP